MKKLWIRHCSDCGGRIYWDGMEGLICRRCGLIKLEPTYSGRALVV